MLKHMLKETPSRISLTSNLWTFITMDGYICLTAHFIDANWKLQKRILSFSFMPPPHTGVALSEKVYGLLAEWEIESKVFSMTLDNASANDTFVDFLKLQLNMRNAFVGNCQFFHLRCCAHILNLVVQDGTKYYTTNLYFPTVFMARLTLDEHSNGDYVYIRKMARLMLDKFDKYWSTFSSTLALVVILDHRYKLQFVEWSYTKFYGNDCKELKQVREKLFYLYEEYVVNVMSSSSSSVSSKPSSKHDVEERHVSMEAGA
ncbi:hypothetical protein REPUB_Repub13aG0008300 [Reevesia pubescens]